MNLFHTLILLLIVASISLKLLKISTESKYLLSLSVIVLESIYILTLVCLWTTGAEQGYWRIIWIVNLMFEILSFKNYGIILDIEERIRTLRITHYD